ncbi:MAG TPA: hypothetical protein PKN32_05340 [Bacteroidales bacterium]|nr:hypothetical protein [Bacteroidales bacterium]
MKRKFILIIFVFTIFGGETYSQSIGFSYFFPKNGYFSNPVAPVNFSLPVKMSDFFQISPGIGLYHIGGMSMTGFSEEYNSERALVGPFQSMELTLLPAIVIGFKKVKFDLVGGLFGFWGFNEKVIKSEFIDMIAEAHNFSVIDSDLNCKKSGFGWGYIYGIKFSFKVTKSAWGYIGANYYTGSQLFKIDGTYVATKGNNYIESGDFNFNNSKILYQGLQISVGAVLK